MRTARPEAPHLHTLMRTGVRDGTASRGGAKERQRRRDRWETAGTSGAHTAFRKRRLES